MNTVKLHQTTQGIEFYSPFDRALVADLKLRIKSKRPIYKDGKFKHWLIDASEKNTLITLCKANGYEPIVSGHLSRPSNQKKLEILKVMYIGQCKQRDDGDESAFAYFNNDWSIVFPKQVLQRWFDAGLNLSTPVSTNQTLHGVLNLRWNDIMEMAPIEADKAIKTAWRKQLRRYHPDVNKDDDAAEMTKKVMKAYKALNTPNARMKYQVGLRLEAQFSLEKHQQPQVMNHKNYRPPIRCGMITAFGVWRVGRFYVDEIKAWRAITNMQGQELVTSWKSGQNKFSESWI